MTRCNQDLQPAGPVFERAFISLQEFCNTHRVHKSTVYRNRQAYPRLSKVAGKTVIMRTAMRKWEDQKSRTPQ